MMQWLILFLTFVVWLEFTFYLDRKLLQSTPEIKILRDDIKCLFHVRDRTKEQQLEYMKLKSQNKQLFGEWYFYLLISLGLAVLFAMSFKTRINVFFLNYYVLYAYLLSFCGALLIYFLVNSKYKWYVFHKSFWSFVFYFTYAILFYSVGFELFGYTITFIYMAIIFIMLNFLYKKIRRIET